MTITWRNIVSLAALLFVFAQTLRGQNFSSELPLVLINTNGQTIVDEPKILVQMGIVWNGAGKLNRSTDTPNNYNGKVGIEIRGSSSQSFPKKSYGFETKSNDGQDMNASLLGLPAEEDWILYGPYSDKSLIRNVLTFTLDATLGHYSPRCRYVELFLNGGYQGVYVLMEKIKRNKNRVSIAKLTADETAAADISGGYIIKIDKTTGATSGGWYSSFANTTYGRTYYQYDYPKPEEINGVQKNYIQNYVYQFEKVLYYEQFKGTGAYTEFMNDSSFVDFFLINELTKNVDGYRLSSYLFKDKNGKLNCGPIWDYNLGWGNADYYEGYATSGFQYKMNIGQDNWQVPFWWNKLMRDAAFTGKIKCRWNELRQKQLSTERILSVVDSLTFLLRDAEARNFQRWPVLGLYVWPNYYVASTYEAEIAWTKNWIRNRLDWLDNNMIGTCTVTGMPELAAEASCRVYPNPFIDRISVSMNQRCSGKTRFLLYNTSGVLVAQSSGVIVDGYTELDYSGLTEGIYFLKIVDGYQVTATHKLVKH